MRIVVITGSNSGIGAACVQAFAAAGDTVVATARNPGRSPGGQPANVEFRPLDVTDPASIRACVDAVLDEHGRIDVLVNNAGIHLQGAVEDMDETDLRRVVETNFFGAIGLTRAVLPAMRAAGAGHVISVSSIGARVGRVTDGAYCASKAALEMAMEALRHEVARFGVRVSVIAPGAYRTAIAQSTASGADADDASPYRALLEFRTARVRDAVAGGGDPADVAALILGVADDPEPGFRYVAGERAREMDRTLNGLDDAGRQALLERLAGIDWWTAGDDRPPPAPGEESR